MFKKTGGRGFEEAEGGEKRDEAKVREFARLLEAVHRLVNSKDDVGLAGGVSLDEGEKVKVGENSGRELLGKEFDILGRVEVQKVNRRFRDIETLLLGQIREEYAKTPKGRSGGAL